MAGVALVVGSGCVLAPGAAKQEQAALARAGLAGAAAGDSKPEAAEPGAAEPLAEWERELLSGDAAAETAPADTAAGAAPETTTGDPA